MKPTMFFTSAVIILLTSATTHAGHGYFTELGRNLGYGIGDGYHAQRNCLPDYYSCNTSPPMHQPMMYHNVDPALDGGRSLMPQPMMHQPMMPQPMMHQPTMAPDYSQWAPQQFQQVRGPVGPVVAPLQPTWQPPRAIQQTAPVKWPQASPPPSPVFHW